MDFIVFLMYLVGFIVSVVVIIAVCQLFAIRHLLEALLRQAGGTVPAAPRVAADLAPVVPTPHRWNLGMGVAVFVFVCGILIWVVLLIH